MTTSEAVTTQHTPGPWRWVQQPGQPPRLVASHSGQLLVMDFVRFGMNFAQPRFSDRNGERRGGIMHKAEALTLADHPDARVIAAAPLLKGTLYRLAMLGLQSDRYETDPDFRDAVDDALAMNAIAEGRTA